MNTPYQDAKISTTATKPEAAEAAEEVVKEVCSLNPQVFYDGSCPLCRREIAFYQHQEAARQADSTHPKMDWIDISKPSQNLPSAYSQAQLMARFHVQDPQGQVRSGAAAFMYLWSLLPGWRYLSYMAKIPGVLILAELAYRFFLRFRPTLQAWMKSKETPTS